MIVEQTVEQTVESYLILVGTLILGDTLILGGALHGLPLYLYSMCISCIGIEVKQLNKQLNKRLNAGVTFMK